MDVLQRACVDKTASSASSQAQQSSVGPSGRSSSDQDQSVAHLITEISELKHRHVVVSQEKEKLMDAVRELDARLQAAEKARRNLESMLEEETRKSASLRAREISSSPATFDFKGKGSRHLAQENETLRATVQQREKSIQELRKQVENASQYERNKPATFRLAQLATNFLSSPPNQKRVQNQGTTRRGGNSSREIISC